MKYDELVEKAATLPRMDPASVPYLVTRVFGSDPNTSLLTLVAHSDGTYTVTHGDLRTKITPMRDSTGRELRFPDEDSVCDWAWEYLQEARGRIPTYDAAQRARDEVAGTEVHRRWDEFVRRRNESHEAIRRRFDLVDRNLDAAIVAFTGFGRVKIPTADADAVLAMTAETGAALLAAVNEAVRISDTIPFDAVAPFDARLRRRLHRRLGTLLPYLGPTAIEALAWRWGFLNVS